MEDKRLIQLYWDRKESAIIETHRAYGGFCMNLAMNILSLKEDAEECVNDSYYVVWNKIPPTLPHSFRAFLGRIVRNLSIDRFRKNRAQKRYNGIELLLSELEECIPGGESPEAHWERKELAEVIGQWLDSLNREDRTLFIRRYWFCEPLQTLAKEHRLLPNTLAQKMMRLRQSLKEALEREGVVL